MASYEKRNNKWTVRFRVGESQRRLSGFTTKREAEQAYFAASATAVEIAREESKVTLERLAVMFLNYKKLRIKESTYMSVKQMIGKYILPYFSAKPVEKITSADIIAWPSVVDAMKLKAGTKRKIHTLLVMLMNYAVHFHGLSANLASKAGNFKNTELKPEMRFWTESEFEQFISAVKNLTFKAFFSTLYLTGARRGEAMALTWKDVDLTKKVITVSKTITKDTVNGAYKVTPPKTASSVRQIVIPDMLVRLLERLHAEHTECEGYSPDCFVFGFSRPLPPSKIERVKNAICQVTGVKRIRIHDFRHSHASLLLNREQNILLVAQRLGHSDIKMTLNTYSHLFPNKQTELMASLTIKLD